MVFNNSSVSPSNPGSFSGSGVVSPHSMLLKSQESKANAEAEETLASLNLVQGQGMVSAPENHANDLFNDVYFESLLQDEGSAVSIDLQPNNASGVDPKDYLSKREQQLLSQLAPKYIRMILDVQATSYAQDGAKDIAQNIHKVIDDMLGNQNVQLKTEGGSEWEVGALLSLASSLQRMPITQRRQLDGVSFIRAPHPPTPPDATGSLIAQVAAQSVAGEYMVHNKSVYLYDRGLNDELPTLNQELKQSLRSMESNAHSSSVEELQTLLNPYLIGLGHESIETNGRWNEATARAVRIVQAELLSRHAGQNHQLTTQQSEALKSMRSLSASPQFDMMSRVTHLKTRMQSLEMLPDPHMRQLLTEFSRGDFGEASLRALMQDISNDFRSTPSVTRAEEVILHETGHHFQLGLNNEQHYIAEFGKLSNWRESSGKAADGYTHGKFAPEELMDVYNILASDGQVDAGHYSIGLSPQERSQSFVSTYAATDPMEDFAESYKAFVLEPEKLMARSPRKFFFINALPSIQARRTGAGARQISHYQTDQIKGFAKQVLSQRHQVTPTDSHVDQFIQRELEGIMGMRRADGRGAPLNLHPDVVLAVVDTHQDLMEKIKMPYVASDRLYESLKKNDPDYQVFRMLHLNTQSLIESKGENQRADVFFQRFQDPREIDHLFPMASEGLRERLKDPAFSSMMLVLGQIGGHAAYINEVQNVENAELEKKAEASEFLSKAWEEPTSLFSLRALEHVGNYGRGLVNEYLNINPEMEQLKPSQRFFQQLKDNPREAFPEVWEHLPQDFRNLLSNARFIESISGDQGRYLPSADVVRNTLEEVMEMVEYERGFQALLNASD